MNHLSACAVCKSDNNVALPLATHYSGLLGFGLIIKIGELETGARAGCQLCILLSNFLQRFKDLSPDFVTSYRDREPSHIFLQPSDSGSLLVALQCWDTNVDYLELYSDQGESWN